MGKKSKRKKNRRIRASYVWAGLMSVCALAALFAAVWVVITVFEKIEGDSSQWALETSEAATENMEIETEEVYGWVTDDKGIRFREEDGTFAAAVWKLWENQLYYLKDDGYMAEGELKKDGQIFAFDELGKLADIQADTSWRGLTGEDNPDNLDSLVKGHMFWAYRGSEDVEGNENRNTGSFRPIYYRKTTEMEAKPLGGEAKPEVTTVNSMQIYDGYLYYLPQVSSQEYLRLSESEQELCNKLFRMKPGTSEKELLAENVTGYLILEDGTVYYAADGEIKKAGSGTPYESGEKQYQVQLKDGAYYLVDSMGNPAEAEENGRRVIGDRVYRLKDGKIENVYPAERKAGDTLYTLENEGQNPEQKAIYKAVDGVRTLAAQAPYGINSFCLADGILYYSAYVERGADGTRYSAIYRMNPESLQPEQISERFPGNILNLYYYEDSQKIYGEYTPTSWKNCYGQIVVIDRNGMVNVIDDSASRESADKNRNEILSLVMAEGNTISTYLRLCEFSNSEGVWKIVSEKPYQFTDVVQVPVTAAYGLTGEGEAPTEAESSGASEEENGIGPEGEAAPIPTETSAVRPTEPSVSKPMENSGPRPTEAPVSRPTETPAPKPAETLAPAPTSGHTAPAEPGPGQPVSPGGGAADSEIIPTVEANPESAQGGGPGENSDGVHFIGPGGAS
ncbi:MAG: hypothetical protein Q4F29_04970 [Lachnospiraceae bacterium]|nr:hypothetical protein [Lachnospiraceae bacterium]